LNTCCDVACPTFQLPHITIGSFHQCQPTIGSFQSHQRFEERNITFSQMKKFCILQGNVTRIKIRTGAVAVESVMREAGVRAGRLPVGVESQEASPAERVSATAEVDPDTAWCVGTTELAREQRVGRRQADRSVHCHVGRGRPRYTRYTNTIRIN